MEARPKFSDLACRLQGILLETSISDPLAREFWGTCFSGKVNHPPLPYSVFHALSRPNASSLTFACRGFVINQNEVELEVFQQSFYEFLGLPEPNKKNDVKCSCLLAILKELRMWILLLLLLHRVGAMMTHFFWFSSKQTNRTKKL